MEDLKSAARRAKRRLKTNFWQQRKAEAVQTAARARAMGMNEVKVKSNIVDRAKSDIRGEKPDDFYLKVKNLLETCGEVSDAIGRLTDKEYYASLSYEEKQRYTLQLSAKYLAALEKYKAEKEMDV